MIVTSALFVDTFSFSFPSAKCKVQKVFRKFIIPRALFISLQIAELFKGLYLIFLRPF